MHNRYPEKFAKITQDTTVLRKISTEVDIGDATQIEHCRVLAEEMSEILLINKIEQNTLGKTLSYADINSLADCFKNIQLDAGNIIGYGLAARQLKSQEAVDTPRLSVAVLPRAVRGSRTLQAGQLLWMVNPTLLRSSIMKRYKGEGCLSMPGVYHNTDRHMLATVGFIDLIKLLENPTDPLKAAREIEFAGVEAVVMQHELDHHDGKLFTDKARVPAVKQDKIGMNEPCPCGSGKKYKKCCAGKI